MAPDCELTQPMEGLLDDILAEGSDADEEVKQEVSGEAPASQVKFEEGASAADSIPVGSKTKDEADEGSSACAHEALTCSVCLMTSDEVDLTDPSSSRQTPFKNMLHACRASTAICDHCDSLLRYSCGGSRSVSGKVVLMQKSSKKVEYLRRFCCYVALKACESVARVQKATLDKQCQIAEVYEKNLQLLCERHGLVEHRRDGAFKHVIALPDYVKLHGNPFINEDSVIPGLANDQVTLFVLSSRPLPAGRHSMERVLAESAVHCGATEPLAKLSVDELPVIRVVAHLLEEFGTRLKLQETMGLSGFLGASLAKDPSCSSGLGRGGDETSYSSQMPIDSQCEAKGSDRAGSVASEPCNSDAADAHAARGREATASAAASCSLVSRASAEAALLSSQPATRGQGGAIAAGHKKQRLGAGRTPRDSKAIDATRRKLMSLVEIFGAEGWNRKLRGKSRVADNIADFATERVKRCGEEQREDLIEDLGRLHSIALAAKKLIEEGKAKDLDAWVATDFVEPLKLIEEFFQEWAEQHDCEATRLEPQLRKMQVRPAATHKHLMEAGGMCVLWFRVGGHTCANSVSYDVVP